MRGWAWSFVVAWLGVQDPIVVLESTAVATGPTPVCCGLIEAGTESKAPWRAVRLSGAGVVAPAVLVKRPFGSVLHAAVPRVGRGGPVALWAGRGPAEELPRSRLVVDHGEALYESEGCRIVFGPDGSLEIGEIRCRLHPPVDRDGGWVERESDPMRSVLVFETATAGAPAPPALSLWAIVWAGVPAVELTLVVRGMTGSTPAALGLAFGPLRERDPPIEESETAASRPAGDGDGEPPAGPAFDVVFEDLRATAWQEVALRGPRTSAVVRRHGPTAPAAIEGSPGAAERILLVADSETVEGGETRVLRLHLVQGSQARDVVARPGRFPSSLPGGGRFRSIASCSDLARLRRKLEAAIGVFRSDPRHGLLHLPGDLGDWRMDGSRFGNLEWDTALGFLLRFLDAGERIDAWQAVCGVEHLLLKDRDPETGIFFQHGRSHRSGVVEPGHHWSEGLAAVAAWLDDPWLVSEARQVAADQIAALSKLDLTAALPRSIAWGMTALCALHELAPDREASRALIARMERFVLGRQSAAGHFMLERSSVMEGAFRVSPFVDGGILLPALERARAVTRNGKTPEAVRRARAALLADGVVIGPEGPRLSSSVLIEPRSGRMIARGGWAEGEEIVLFLSGIGGGIGREVETRLIRRAEETLTLDARTYLGKGISMLMRALPAYAARSRCR